MATSSASRSDPAPVSVAEVMAEAETDGEPEIPWAITPEPGRVALQLRTTAARVVIGSGLARRPDLVAAVRALPSTGSVVTSPVAGTFVVGGPGWLGLCGIGRLVPDQPLPLDWMMTALSAWFGVAFQYFGVAITVGRVEGAWCPGFSDIAVAGRKLVGLGFRVTREWVVMRGVMAVQPLSDADLTILQQCHRLIDLDVHGEAAISLAEASGNADLDVPTVIETMRRVTTR